jgi:phage gpG-like protein
MYSVSTTLEWSGDRDVFERGSKRIEKPAELMRSIGVVGMAGSQMRLRNSLDPDEIHTGRLAGSLNVSEAGQGGPNTIFEVGQHQVEIGSNVRYAAQKNFGGRIVPVHGKALAIPLLDRIKRTGIGPGKADPMREIYDFIPVRGGAKGNVIGILVDSENVFGARGNERGEAHYAIATFVDQVGSRFMGWDRNDERTVEEDIWPRYLKAA